MNMIEIELELRIVMIMNITKSYKGITKSYRG